MEKFKSFFLWSYKTKVGVSIWAMVITVCNAFFGAISGEICMNYWMIVEILVVAFIIGGSFNIIFKRDVKIERVLSAKSLCFVLISFSSLLIASLVFNWLASPLLYVIYFALMIVGMFTLIIAEKWLREEKLK